MAERIFYGCGMSGGWGEARGGFFARRRWGAGGCGFFLVPDCECAGR